MHTVKLEKSYTVDPHIYDDRDKSRAEPWKGIDRMRPYKPRPAGILSQYQNTRFDLLVEYLTRKGYSLETQCQAYVFAFTKVIMVDSIIYLTGIDGLIHTKEF